MLKFCVYCSRKCPDGDITFHKIPSDEERRKKWLNAMKLPDEKVAKNSYLCSKHFESSTFCCQVVNKVVHRFLDINAVPNIFTENHSSKQLFTECYEEDENEDKDEEEKEDCYFYKIENGIIKRYLRNNIKIPESSLTRNKEIYSKGNAFDLILNEFNNHKSSSFTCQDITIVAKDISFDQTDFSHVNEINEIEITTCETESLEINGKETISAVENVDIKVDKKKLDNLCNGTVISSRKEVKKQNDNIAITDDIDKKNSETQDNGIKNVLYEYLEKNKSFDMNVIVEKCTELTLTDLLKRVLNYIECLEEKLKASAEKNKQYEIQIVELEKLLYSCNINRNNSNFT